MDEALSDTIGSIKNAKTETEAMQIATELFGKKGAAEMTKAIRDAMNLSTGFTQQRKPARRSSSRLKRLWHREKASSIMCWCFRLQRK